MAETPHKSVSDRVASAINDLKIRRYDLEHTPAVDQLRQALLCGRIDKCEAASLAENAPRLVAMLCEGLGGMFGKVTPRRFVELAQQGLLTTSVLERAMR